MRKLTIEISNDIVDTVFRTGNTIDRSVISSGLPDDSRLRCIYVCN